MKQVFDIIKEIQEKKNKRAISERASVIQQFVEEINKERMGTKYKPVSGTQIAIKLSHLKLSDLYTFLSLARDYKNRQKSFSKYFFGVLKNKWNLS